MRLMFFVNLLGFLVASSTASAQEPEYLVNVGDVRSSIATVLALNAHYEKGSGNYIFEDAGVEVVSGERVLKQFHDRLPIWGSDAQASLARDVLYYNGAIAFLIDVDDRALASADMVYLPIPTAFDLDKYGIPIEAQNCVSLGVMLDLSNGETGGKYHCSSASGRVHPCECRLRWWNQSTPCPPPEYSCTASCPDSESFFDASLPGHRLDELIDEVRSFYSQPWPLSWFSVGDAVFSYGHLQSP